MFIKRLLKKYNLKSIKELEKELEILNIYRSGTTIYRVKDENNSGGYIIRGDLVLVSSHCPKMYDYFYENEYRKDNDTKPNTKVDTNQVRIK